MVSWRSSILPVVALGLLAGLQYWLGPRRPAPVELRAAQRIVVTSAADSGSGSLRQALLDAANSPVRTRIELAVDRVLLEDPLPPLIHPRGTVVDGSRSGSEIDASRILDGSVFDVRAPDSVLAGLAIRGAFGSGVLVRADRVLLDGLTITRAGDGVNVAKNVAGLEVRNSEFRANSTGLRVQPGARKLVIRNNRFSAHEDAAIWAVAADPGTGAEIEISGNHFSEDRISLVLGNGSALVVGNDFEAAFESALHLLGRGAEVRGNRIRNARLGIVANHASGSLIADNEIDHTQGAIVLTSASGPVISGNRFYSNVAGITMVLSDTANPGELTGNLFLAQAAAGVELVGSSPRLEGNRFLESLRAGLRLTDHGSEPALVRSEPTLKDNLLDEVDLDLDRSIDPEDQEDVQR